MPSRVAPSLASSTLAAYLFLRTPGNSVRSTLVPRSEDLRDYVRLARRGLDALARKRSWASQ